MILYYEIFIIIIGFWAHFSSKIILLIVLLVLLFSAYITCFFKNKSKNLKNLKKVYLNFKNLKKSQKFIKFSKKSQKSQKVINRKKTQNLLKVKSFLFKILNFFAIFWGGGAKMVISENGPKQGLRVLYGYISG